MEIRTKYITPDDFKTYFGIDLDLELKNSGNPSDTAMAFLKRIEDRLSTFIDSSFYRTVDEEYPEFTDYQKYHYWRALLEQALYVYRNGEISVDSFMDYENGEKADISTVMAKKIAPNCREELLLCGLWCTKIRPSRSPGLWGGLW